MVSIPQLAHFVKVQYSNTNMNRRIRSILIIMEQSRFLSFVSGS